MNDEQKTLDLNRQENYRTEYKEISSNHRLFVNLRFITAAFTAAIQSALLTFYGRALEETKPTGYLIMMIPVVGFFSTLAVSLIEQRNIQLFRSTAERGRDLEFPHMGIIGGQFARFQEMHKQKGLKKLVSHTWGIGFVYLLFLTMWIFLYVLNLISQ